MAKTRPTNPTLGAAASESNVYVGSDYQPRWGFDGTHTAVQRTEGEQSRTKQVTGEEGMFSTLSDADHIVFSDQDDNLRMDSSSSMYMHPCEASAVQNNAAETDRYASLAALGGMFRDLDPQARESAVNDGAALFDRMIATEGRGMVRIGNGFWTGSDTAQYASPFYRNLGITSPTELFYVDGRPIRELVDRQFSDPLGEEYEKAAKAMIMSLLLCGSGRVTMAQATTGELGDDVTAAELEGGVKVFARPVSSGLGHFQSGVRDISRECAAGAKRARQLFTGSPEPKERLQVTVAGFAERCDRGLENYRRREAAKTVIGTVPDHAKTEKEICFSPEDLERLTALDSAFKLESRGSERFSGSELSRGGNLGGVVLLCQGQALAMARNRKPPLNPPARMTDLLNLDSPRMKEGGDLFQLMRESSRTVTEALVDYADGDPAQPEYGKKMAAVMKNFMAGIGHIDMKAELLNAAGAEPELKGEEVRAAISRPEVRRKVDAAMEAVSAAAGIKAYQLINNFKPRRAVVDKFLEGKVPETFQNPGNLYPPGTDPAKYAAPAALFCNLAEITEPSELDAAGRTMQNMQFLYVRHNLTERFAQSERVVYKMTARERYQMIAQQYMNAYTERQITQGVASQDLPWAMMGNRAWSEGSIADKMAARLAEYERRMAGLPEGETLPPDQAGRYLTDPHGQKEKLTLREQQELGSLLDHAVLSQAFREGWAETLSSDVKEEYTAPVSRSIERAENAALYTEDNTNFFGEGRSVSAIRMMMLNNMDFDEMLRQTVSAAQMKQAGNSFIEMEAEFGDMAPEQWYAQYGELYRTGAERLRGYRLPAGDPKDVSYAYSNAEKMAALGTLLKDLDANLDGKTELGGHEEFLQGFADGEKDFQIENYRAGLRVMGQYAQACVLAVDPSLLPEYKNASPDELAARQMAGKLFLEAYGDVFAGKSAREIEAGLGSRELAGIQRFMDTTVEMASETLANGTKEEKDAVRGYLANEGNSPISAGRVEREIGYINLFDGQTISQTISRRRADGQGLAPIDRAVLDRGLTGTRAGGRSQRDRSYYGEDNSFAALHTAAREELEASVQDLASDDPWKKDLYALHRLGKNPAEPNLIEMGSQTFDSLFQKLNAEDASLGNGDFAKANSVYAKAGIQSPTELFFVDGKPIREYMGDKYPGLSGEQLDMALKAEIVAAAVSGKHHVEMAKVQLGEEGGLEIGVSELNLDLSVLDSQAGFLRGKPSSMARKLQESDKPAAREERRGNVRSHFGDKLASLLAAQMNREELARRLQEEKRAHEVDLNAYTSEHVSEQDLVQMSRDGLISASGRVATVASNLKLYALSTGKTFEEVYDMKPKGKQAIGEGFMEYVRGTLPGPSDNEAEIRQKHENMGEMFARATVQMQNYVIPVVDLNDKTALQGLYGEMSSFTTMGIDLSQNQEKLIDTDEAAIRQAYANNGLPTDAREREKPIQAASFYTQAVANYVNGMTKDPADMDAGQLNETVAAKFFLETYGKLYSQGKVVENADGEKVRVGKTVKEIGEELSQNDLSVLMQVKVAVINAIGRQHISDRQCAAYLRGEAPIPLDVKQLEETIRASARIPEEQTRPLWERAQNAGKVSTNYNQMQQGRQTAQNAVSQEAAAWRDRQRENQRQQAGPSRTQKH